MLQPTLYGGYGLFLRFGTTKWHSWLQIFGGYKTWWLDIRLMNILVPGQENILVWPQIYPILIGKVTSSAHFPFKLDCEDYTFLDKSFKDFECSLDSILMDFIETLDLYIFFDEPAFVTSSVSLVHSGNTFLIALNQVLVLSPNVVHYGARHL